MESQLSKLISMMCQRPPSGLPNQPEPNPKESVKAITLRSGKRYDSPTMLNIEKVSTDDQSINTETNLVPTEGDLEKEKEKRNEKPIVPKNTMKPYKPKIPFPQRLRNNNSDP